MLTLVMGAKISIVHRLVFGAKISMYWVLRLVLGKKIVLGTNISIEC